MKDTITDDLIALQEDPSYFSPQTLEQPKEVFDRICRELGISDVQKARRDNQPSL